MSANKFQHKSWYIIPLIAINCFFTYQFNVEGGVGVMDPNNDWGSDGIVNIVHYWETRMSDLIWLMWLMYIRSWDKYGNKWRSWHFKQNKITFHTINGQDSNTKSLLRNLTFVVNCRMELLKSFCPLGSPQYYFNKWNILNESVVKVIGKADSNHIWCQA